MNKLLSAALICCALLTSPTHADTTIVNQSPKASVMTGFTIVTQNSAKVPMTFYQSRDCQDAANVFKNNSNSAIVYETMNVAAAKAKNLNCKIDFTSENVALYTWQSFEFCRLAGNKTSMLTASTFGMSGMHPHQAFVSEFNKTQQAKLSAKIYSGSGATAKGLLANEVDWAFIASAVAKPLVSKGVIECPYTTDPTSASYFGKNFNHSLADLRIKVLVLSRGSDTTAIRQNLQSSEFQEYLMKSGYSNTTSKMTDEQIKRFEQEYTVLQRSYN